MRWVCAKTTWIGLCPAVAATQLTYGVEMKVDSLGKTWFMTLTTPRYCASCIATASNYSCVRGRSYRKYCSEEIMKCKVPFFYLWPVLVERWRYFAFTFKPSFGPRPTPARVRRSILEALFVVMWGDETVPSLFNSRSWPPNGRRSKKWVTLEATGIPSCGFWSSI